MLGFQIAGILVVSICIIFFRMVKSNIKQRKASIADKKLCILKSKVNITAKRCAGIFIIEKKIILLLISGMSKFKTAFCLCHRFGFSVYATCFPDKFC